MIANRVQETTTSTGTGNLTLAGAVANHQTINTGIGTNVRFPYFVIDDTNNAWEHGIGYLSDATTLVRETFIESTNSNAAVNFAAGTKQVFVGGSALSNNAISTGYSALSSQLKYQAPANHVRVNASRQLSAGRTIWSAVFYSRPSVINQLAIDIATANGTASNKIHIGLYDITAAGEPGNRICSVVDLDPSTTGVKSGSVTAQMLPAGWYYSAFWSDAAPQLTAQDGFIVMPQPFSADPNLVNQGGWFYRDGATGLTDLPTVADHTAFANNVNQPCLMVGHS